MQKIIVAKYDIIKGLVFYTEKEKGKPLPKHTQERKTPVVDNKKVKKVKFNRQSGYTSSKRIPTISANIVLNIIEQEIETNCFETNKKNVINRKQYDKKATLNLKKLRQAKMLMRNASFDFYQEER